MLYVHTLGGLYLSQSGGSPLSGAASQRRLLALLAVLAASGDAGLSRDRLVSLLWPDVDEENGRHSLTQAMYHARRTLERGDLFVAGADVRMNADCIGSDVGDFEAAVRAHDLDRAARLYRGPFLDGFHLQGNGALERWVEAQRRRLRDRAIRVLGVLATRAVEARDLSAAIGYRRRSLVLDPLDTTTTRHLVETMIAAGDETGALKQLQLHERLIRSELGVAPAPELQGLARRLRESLKPRTPRPSAVADAVVAPPVSNHSADPNAVPAARREEQPAEAPNTQLLPKVEPPPSRRLIRASRRYAPLAIGIIALTGAVWTAFASRDRATAPSWAPRVDESIVVAPFRVTGAEPKLAFLREGLVELLSIRLSGDGAAGAVDAGAVVRAWRQSRWPDSTDTRQSEAVRFAERLGAAGVVVGSVVGDSRHLVVTASLISVRDTALRVTASADGPADSLTAIVDRVSARLLADRAGEAERFADRTTTSLPALRAYLAGRAADRNGASARALDDYERALRYDSTFALAAMHLALLADRLNAGEQHDRALSLAWAYRGDLTERDRLHLIAFAGPRYPRPSTEAEQLAAWEAAVAASPDRVEALTELAERIVRVGPVLGVKDPERRATAILRHVLELDSMATDARRQLLMLAARAGDVGQIRRIATRPETADTTAGLAGFVRWRVALANRDSQMIARVRAAMTRMNDASLRAIGMTAQFDAVAADDGERALRIRALRATHAGDQLDAILAQHSLALNQGHPLQALRFTEQLEEAQPGSRAHLRLRVLDALYGGGDSAAAERAAASLAPVVDAPPRPLPSARAVQLADACALGQWRIANRQLADVRRLISELREEGIPRDPVPVGANPHMCAEILATALAVATHAHGASTRVARLDSLMLGGPAANDAAAYAHILVARLYEQLGDPRAALDAIRRRAYMDGWPRYLATARREEGRLALVSGDRTGWRSAYGAYLALRQAPEAAAAAEVAGVRSAIRDESDRTR